MAQFPALPIWTDAYLADCAHLTDAEHGIYLQVLMLMWRSPDCRIPDDDEWIARKMRRDANAVRTHVRTLMREFCQTGEGWITQKRLQKEWRWCMEKRNKNSKSAKSRWNNDSTSCERNANAMPDTQCERNAPTPFPTSKKETTPNGVEKKGTRFALADPPGEWIQFCATQRPDLDPGATFDRFRDYWIGKPGKDGLKTDWTATWRNWVRGEKSAPAKGNSYGQPTKDQRMRAALARSLASQGIDVTGGQGGGETPGD